MGRAVRAWFLIACVVACLAQLLLGCGQLTHVDPQLRSPADQYTAVVRISVSCEDQFMPDDLNWMSPDKSATATVLSEKHMVTAAHAVSCTSIPHVNVFLANGDAYTAVVDRDEATFGNGADIARIRLLGAFDRLGLRVAPPLLTSDPGEFVCIQPFKRHEVCGPVVGPDTALAATHPGDSGAPVYDTAGRLAGIVVSGDGVRTHWEPVDESFLKGT